MSGKSKQVGKGTPTKVDKSKSSDKEELKKCKSELQKAKDKIVTLEDQNNNLLVRVLSFEHNFNYEEVRRRLPESLDGDGLFATENARLVAEIKILEAELEAIKRSKESTSATQTTTVTENVSQQSESHGAELKKKDDEISGLRKQVKELIELESKNEELTKEVVEQKKKITKLDTTITELKKEIVQKTNEIAELEKQSSELKEKPENNDNVDQEQEKKELKEKLEESNNINVDLEQEKKELKEKLEESNNIKSQLETTNEDLTKRLADNSKQTAELGEEIRGLKETIEKNKIIQSDLEEEIGNLKAELKTVTEIKERNVEDTQLAIQETTPTHTKELEELKRKLNKAERHINSLEREKTKLETEMTSKEGAIEVLRREKADVESKMKEAEKRLEGMRKEKTDSEMKLSEKEKDYMSTRNSLMRENSNLKKRINQLENDKDNLEKKNTQTSSKASTKELEEEIKNLKNRLSQMAGAQLLTNNPNIADLSDSNRPTKLAEQYSELYDNEWTNAFEVLESQGKSETEIIQKLYERILEIYHHCSKVANQYGETLNAMVIGAEKKHIKDVDIPQTKLRQLKDVRKAFAPEMAEIVIKKYMEKAPKEGENMNAYITKCVTLCWFMSVQDPPVVIDTKTHTGTFNGDIFKTYTKSGKTLDYVVWPPLYLHEGGPMLCKGVAQGK